jgi:hypothetical protein
MPELASGAKEVFHRPVEKNLSIEAIEESGTPREVWRSDSQELPIQQHGNRSFPETIPTVP